MPMRRIMRTRMPRDRVTSGRERLPQPMTAVPVVTAALRFEEFEAGA